MTIQLTAAVRRASLMLSRLSKSPKDEMPTSAKRLLLILTIALLAACESKTLEIESNTTWSGAVGGTGSRSIQGSGNQSISITGTDTYCWTLQKETRTGTLRAYAKVHTITGVDNQDDETTTADFGLVSGCTK